MRCLCSILTGPAAVLALALLPGCGGDDNPGPFTRVPAGICPLASGSLAWGDYDNDGYLDLLTTGTESFLGPAITLLYRNTPHLFRGRWFWEVPGALPDASGGDVEWGDFNHDGFLDVAIACLPPLPFRTGLFSNNGGSSFTEEPSNVFPFFDGAMAWGDYDNDGRMDLAVVGMDKDTDNRRTEVYRNDAGMGLVLSGQTFPGVWDGDIEWGDFDNDGDLDLIFAGVGDFSADLTKLYENLGDGTFSELAAGFLDVSAARLAWGDYDSDGDLDLALAGFSVGGEFAEIYRNDGAGVFTAIGAGLQPFDYGALEWGDYDNDGDLDLLAGIRLTIYTNDGGDQFSENGAVPDTIADDAQWGDYDNDGDLDVIQGYGETTANLYRNNCATPNTAPAAPANLQGVVAGSDVALSWDAATDVETPSAGLTYNVKVRSESGGPDDIMPCMSDPVTGKRRIPAMGNVQLNKSWTLKGLASGTYYWSVQAIDNCFAGSAWASEQSFVIP